MGLSFLLHCHLQFWNVLGVNINFSEGVRGFVMPVIDRKDGIPDGKMENIPQLIRNEPGAV